MRELEREEVKKRGCMYCADQVSPTREYRRRCPHDECPYRELDGFETYDEYLKKSKKGGLARLLEALAKKNL